MAGRRFTMVDVFGSGPRSGNPLAVVHDAEGLTTDEMQSITRWLNLSETTFLLPPTDPAADYRVRIFTLVSELPFAGHPTLGTCHAWLEAGGVPGAAGAVVQECGAGLVRIERGDRLAFAAPPLIRDGPVESDVRADVLAVLGITDGDVVDLAWIDNGPGWVGVLLADHDAVLGLRPDVSRSTTGDKLDIGVAGPHPTGHEVDLEVRAFFSDDRGQLVEDPVTGSLNASLAQWLTATNRLPGRYVAAQGTAIGRAGRVHVRTDGDDVWVGGDTTTVVTGTLS